MNGEEERLLRRLRDEAQRAAAQDKAVPGRFLPREVFSEAVHAARQAGVEVSADGGWPDAERVQVCFHPASREACFTYEWLEIRWNRRFSGMEHRALLGSLMHLGVDRSWCGDLLMREEDAVLCCLRELAVRLPQEWREAGRVPLTVRQLEEAPIIRQAQGRLVRDTVASLRLDCVLAGGLGVSRAAAAERIRRGEVSVNHRPEERIDRMLQPGDLLSVRKFGRIRLDAVEDPNRKGRLPIALCILSGKD